IYLSNNAGSINNATQIMANLPSQTARMAMAVVAIGPIILAYPFFQKYFVEGLTIGSIKG
ncbi:MAG TPA: carbohydrate ABC transporter permease, partial [Bacillota bacterium]|nr:carbohydrate ABC transporter permease [Bacillota bacterium]